MKLTCPSCAFEASIDVFLVDTQARAFMAEWVKVPQSVSGQVLKYLTLFRPARRVLTWPRASALLAELAEPIATARLERNGRLYAAPLELWRAGIEAVLANRDAGKLQLPLKGHGYLFEIVRGMADKGEAAAEQKVEDQRRGVAGAGGRVAREQEGRASKAVIDKFMGEALAIVKGARK